MTRIVSFSEIYKFQTCKRQYYYNFDLGLEPEETSEAILTGNKGHKLLENFYLFLAEGKTKEEALKLITEKASKDIIKNGIPDKAMVKAWTLVDNYIKGFEFTAEAIEVESRFLVPASRFTNDPSVADVQFGFTPDLVQRRTGGFLDVEDYKFVGRAWSQKKINRFPQTKLYQIFLEAMDFQVSRTLVRFFNTQTGIISQKSYVLKKEERDILIHDFLDGVHDVLNFRSKPVEIRSQSARTMNYSACQFCHYEVPCSLEAEGKSATGTLTTQFRKRSYDYSS